MKQTAAGRSDSGGMRRGSGSREKLGSRANFTQSPDLFPPPHATAISANPVTFFLTRTYEAKASKHKYNIVKRVSNYKKF